MQEAERTSVRIKDDSGASRLLSGEIIEPSVIEPSDVGDVGDEPPTIDDWATDEATDFPQLRPASASPRPVSSRDAVSASVPPAPVLPTSAPPMSVPPTPGGPSSAPPVSVAPSSVPPPSSEGGFFRPDEERATTLVLMESGAFWPAWVKEVQRRAPNSMVEVQSASESVESFGGRVLRRLMSLRDRGVQLRAAVYAAASPSSEQERGVRRLLCGTLLDVLHDGGELVLSGAGWCTWGVDARSREELMTLAGELSCQLPLSGGARPSSVRAARVEAVVSTTPRAVMVSVRFGEAPDESGIHKAATPMEADARLRKGGRDSGEADDEDDDADLAREIA